MRFVKASPSEFLVVSRHGVVSNRGLAASAVVWPGSSWVLVPSTKHEAAFEMTQETSDGIPLRFKGIVLYHVDDPVRAARLFDFSSGTALTQVATYIGHVSLGELRSAVSRMSMRECTEQRKTTLTDVVAKALALAVPEWGIALDVVQVAQVYIVDPELRRELEAEVRTQIKTTGELAALEARELVARRELETRRRLLAEQIDLKKAEQELVKLELDVERARQDLRLRALPLEQAPRMARALAGMFRGLRISVAEGGATQAAAALTPLVDAVLDLAYAGAPGRTKPRGEDTRDGDQEDRER
jgi:hypothetical protein